MATAIPRISPSELRQKLARGDGTLFVCAYEDPKACRKYALSGAIDFQTLEKRLPSLAKDQEIVFYCA
jgi:hypothetical protein